MDIKVYWQRELSLRILTELIINLPAHQDDLKFPIVTNIQYKQGQNVANSLYQFLL